MNIETLRNIVVIGIIVNLISSFLYALLAKKLSKILNRLKKKWEKAAKELDKKPELIVDARQEVIYRSNRYIGFLILAVLFLVFLFYTPDFSQVFFAVASLLLSAFAFRDLVKVINLRNIIKSTERDKRLRSMI
ncbi:MAG: hypothetical protein HXS48_14900 [Theionarchaea archaeon]|nr:hypothetical protein [Theionarchaea archaeon]